MEREGRGVKGVVKGSEGSRRGKEVGKGGGLGATQDLGFRIRHLLRSAPGRSSRWLPDSDGP